MNRVDAQLHLYGEQEDELKVDVKKLLSSAKAEVSLVEARLKTLDLEKINIVEEEKFLNQLYLSIESRATKVLVKFISKLDKKQREKFIKSHKEKTLQYRDELNEREEEEYYKRFEFFIGDLNQKQKEVIKSEKTFYHGQSEIWINGRVDFIKQYEAQVTSLDSEKALADLFNKNKEARRTKRNRKHSLEIIQMIFDLSSTDQRKKLDELRQEVLEWIAIYRRKH